MTFNIKQLQKVLKINFTNKKLLERSLTHKSFNKSYNNEKLPWILILVGGAILTLRLIVALFSSLSIVDWFAIIIITSGLVLHYFQKNHRILFLPLNLQSSDQFLPVW